MWPRTALTDLLRVQYPIIQAPMASASTAEMAAAVSNAGGLGFFGAAVTPPDQLRQVIRRIRELTARPFGSPACMQDKLWRWSETSRRESLWGRWSASAPGSRPLYRREARGEGGAGGRSRDHRCRMRLVKTAVKTTQR